VTTKFFVLLSLRISLLSLTRPVRRTHSQGGNTFIGAGYGSWTGVVLIEFISITFVAMLGEYIAIDG